MFTQLLLLLCNYKFNRKHSTITMFSILANKHVPVGAISLIGVLETIKVLVKKMWPDYVIDTKYELNQNYDTS